MWQKNTNLWKTQFYEASLPCFPPSHQRLCKLLHRLTGCRLYSPAFCYLLKMGEWWTNYEFPCHLFLYSPLRDENRKPGGFSVKLVVHPPWRCPFDFAYLEATSNNAFWTTPMRFNLRRGHTILLIQNLIFTSFTKNKTTSVARCPPNVRPHLPHFG